MTHKPPRRPRGYTAGATYFSDYWLETYTVLAVDPLTGCVTVQWHGDSKYTNAKPPRQTTHSTPIGKDKQVAGPWDFRRAMDRVEVSRQTWEGLS